MYAETVDRFKLDLRRQITLEWSTEINQCLLRDALPVCQNNYSHLAKIHADLDRDYDVTHARGERRGCPIV
uniref:Transposase n=1 Tax=Panagrellus redivivus TaxID=6233 RepID=A0A7E4WD60_PANRE